MKRKKKRRKTILSEPIKDEIIVKTTGMRAEIIEDLTADYYKYDVKCREQISKKILRKGGPWISIAFIYRDIDIDTEIYSEERLMLASFKMVDGYYTRQSYFIVKKEMINDIIELCKEIK